ncbi:hypothetical protein HAX54_051415, partial [Datura stramonium]|nr:hypothetical protein [Datura stramonium]
KGIDISRIHADAQMVEDLTNCIGDTHRERDQSKRVRTVGFYKKPHTDPRFQSS